MPPPRYATIVLLYGDDKPAELRTLLGALQANIADAVAPYAPPPAYYAPMPYDPPPPPNVAGCVSYNGRWVNANGCN